MDRKIKRKSTSGFGPAGKKAKKARHDRADGPRAAGVRPDKAPVLGDDEDDFELELPDQIDQEEEEDVAEVEEQPVAPTEEEQEPPSGKQKKKRKQAEAADPELQQPAAPEPKPSAKAEKRKAKKQARRLSAAGWSAAKAAAAGIAAAPPARQAEWLWASFAAVTGATFLEREGLDEGAVASLPQTGSLEERLFAHRAGWREELAAGGGEPGAPLVLVLASSAATANSLAKLFPTVSKGCRVAKLFAKHFKVEQQQADLRRPVAVASGTPNRVDKLAELGSLSLARLRLLLLDAALDAKERSILDIPEVRGDWWRLFGKVKGAVAAGRTKIALIDSSKLL